MQDSSRMLVAQSIQQINQQSERFQQSFYQHLYQQVPAARALFPNTTAEKTKLVSMLSTFSRLSNFDKLKPAIIALGKRHLAYGVSTDMYPPFKQALLATIQETLQEDADSASLSAWNEVLDELIDIMQKGDAHE